MPSDAFIGILTGLGEAHRARQKNIFDQEVARREQMAKAIEKLAEHPSITPEGAEQYYKQAFGIRTSDINKKLPKEWESLATEVALKFGQSWLGGQTSRKVEAQNMPIASDLEGQSTRTPPPSQFEAPMPQPPPGAQRSAFYSPQELSRQKMAAAVEMLQALGPIQQQQTLETRRAELAMQPEEFFAVAPGYGVAKRSTGEFTTKPTVQPEKPPDLSFEEATYEDYLKDQALTAKYGPTRIGFDRYKQDQAIARSKALQQPPFIIRTEGAITNAAGELPREWRNAVTRAMPSNATPAVRLARLNEAASYIEAGDMEGLKSRIRQIAIEGENVGTQAQVEGRADAMAAMKDAVSLMGDMQREGVATNILTGTWEDIMRKLGTTSHPKRVEFASRLQRALSAYTLAMSGVQFSEAEAVRYNRLFPNYSNTMPVNKALANALLAAMETEDRRFWNQKLGPDGAKLVGATTGSTPGSAGSTLDDEIMNAIRGVR